MAELSALEHPTLKVPYELLNKKFRMAQRSLDREMHHVTNAVSELEKVLMDDPTSNSSNQQISSLLGGVMDKLSSFKRKADEATQEEIECGRVIKRRIEHLKDHDSPNQTIKSQWKKTRLDRLLAEYLLRAGFFETAHEFVKEKNLEGLTNMDIFLVAHEVERSLKEKDTSKVLTWCHDNKSKLRKMNSTLEFNIRVQEFIELIKQEKRMDAVWHARKHLSSPDNLQATSIQQCMGLIAFPVDTELSPYKEMFSENRWTQLMEQFREENLKIFQISNPSSFSVVMQAGLSALKTPHCYRGRTNQNTDCPICHKNLNELAASLPYAHCSQSRLVCSISGERLNEDNRPMMLPNGYVYGKKALEQMASENNGIVVCPRSQQTFTYMDAEKVYIM